MARTDRNTRTRPRRGDSLSPVLCQTKKIYIEELDEHFIMETHRRPSYVPGCVLQERRAADSMRDQLLDYQLDRELGTVEEELDMEQEARHMKEMYKIWWGDMLVTDAPSLVETQTQPRLSRRVSSKPKKTKRRIRIKTVTIQPDGAIKRTRRVKPDKLKPTSILPPHLRDPECAERR